MKTIWSSIGEHDDEAIIVTDSKGNPEPDPALRDTENVPLTEDIEEYFAREVLPHVPDAWIDHDKTKIGYEIPFTRHFYRYIPPRPLEEIQKDLRRPRRRDSGHARRGRGMTWPYRDYQESGIPGLGEVPTGWSVTRMDKHLRYVKQQISSEALAGQDVFHYSIPVVQVTGSGAVEDGSTIDSSKFKIDRELILISKLNPRKATICRAAPQGQLTVCSTEFVPLAGQGIDLDFVQYILMSNTYRQRLESLVESATRSHQRVAPIRHLPVLVGHSLGRASAHLREIP